MKVYIRKRSIKMQNFIMSQCISCSDSARFPDKFTVILTMEGSFLVVKISRKILQLQENKKRLSYFC